MRIRCSAALIRSLSILMIAGASISCDDQTDVEENAGEDEASNDSGTDDDAADESVARCERVRASIEDAGFGDEIEVRCETDYAYVISDTYPDHDLMNGITGTNEQVPVEAVDYASPVKLAPSLSGQQFTHDAALGVAVNGVPIYDYSTAGELDLDRYDPNVDTLLLGQLDNCGGHAGRGDDYHYHAKPTCMIDAMANTGDDTILGWAFDGYPLYGDQNPDGTEITEGDLDVCNGQPDDEFGYRYHTSEAPPYVWQCLVGEFDDSPDFLPRVSPLIDSSGEPRPDGVPVPGGADTLSFVVDDDGYRTLTYTFGDDEYFVRYRPSDQPGCFDFEFLSVSFESVQRGEYCR